MEEDTMGLVRWIEVRAARDTVGWILDIRKSTKANMEENLRNDACSFFVAVNRFFASVNS